ncbi:MAG: DUF192 domain-containing protein [Patescibacteria group bacterium]
MKRKSLHLFFLGAIAATLMVFAWAIFRVFITEPKNPPLKTEELVLAGETFRVEIADSLVEKALGLSGREGLREGDGSTRSPHGGMLFIFDHPSTQTFWMKEMLFPIDIIWINGTKIIGFAENAQTEQGKKPRQLELYSSPGPADRVLEVRAGTVARLGVKVGDEISLR